MPAKEKDNDQNKMTQPAPSSPFIALHALSGSLPLNLQTAGKQEKLAPAVVFAPPHLIADMRPFPRSLPTNGTTDRNRPLVEELRLVNAMIVEPGTGTDGDIDLPPTDKDFLEHVETMLSDGYSGEKKSRFTASATDASYDFDEYVFLRNPDDPISPELSFVPGSPQIIPTDPRFKRFVREAYNGIASFIEYASLPLQGVVSTPDLFVRIQNLQMVLQSWWINICAIRAFNLLGRYSRSDIKRFNNYGFSPEGFYSASLYYWLGSVAYNEAYQYLLTGDGMPAGPLKRLLTVDFWENVRVQVFEQYFDANRIAKVDPTAPNGEYPFDPYPSNEVLFGIQVIHRQTWHLLDYARGELVKSIPLGPKESQKVSVKILRRRKIISTSEESTSYETTTETSRDTKDTAEVINEASRKLNAHVEAEAGINIFTLVTAKVSAGLALERASSSKQTKARLNEVMQKTTSRMKRDTKVTMSTESEDTFEENRSSELTNPNDEIAITYLYHRLQQRYWVSTRIAEVHSVVFVPEPLPAWEDINEDWVRQHGDIIAGALLDPQSAPILATICKEPPNLTYSNTNVFDNAAQAGINAAAAYKDFQGGAMPDLLASGQQAFERDYERRNSLAMDQARRLHQSQALLTHIRRNILHYMRAIWASEDYDQRMQRLSRMRVPTVWNFVPRSPLPAGAGPATPLEVDGVFMPDPGSALPLTDVIDPIGPIGYLLNCAIYRLRDDPKLVNLHQALAYLRAAYIRFLVTVSISAGGGVTLRQVVAVSPRSFSADYTITYRAARGKWLIPVPGRNEGDWIEVRVLPDGSLEVLGLRIWLDGAPADQATLTIRVRATNDLEDPHLRLVEILNPLPSAGNEDPIFTDNLLQEMVTMLPELLPPGLADVTWDNLTEAQKNLFRDHYHWCLMLRESGTLVTLDTANLILDLEIGKAPALEPFKRLHRYLDVRKAYEDLRRSALDNIRREELLKKGTLGDPDIERVTLVGTRNGLDLEDVIALDDRSDE